MSQHSKTPKRGVVPVLLSGAVFLVGCGSSQPTETFASGPNTGSTGAGGGTGSSTGANGVGGSLFSTTTTGTSGMSNGSNGSTGSGVTVLPANFVATEFGGYALGPALNGDSEGDAGAGSQNSNGQNCNLILGVVRDFQFANVPNGGHPDFENYNGGETKGLVAMALGADQKPVYASQCEATLVGGAALCPGGQMTTSKAYFDMWYRFTDMINKPYIAYFQFVPNGSVFTFESELYFPLDNAGWGNSGTGHDGKQHNFSFTTEIHTTFLYKGGEQFTFIGDDDVWVYMNHKLGIDLGGVHGPATGTIDVDQSAASLGLVKGMQYALDVFQAERHTQGSTFRIDTNLAFTNCGSVVPDIPK